MQNLLERSWKLRRWAVFSSLAVCDVTILYLMVFGKDTALERDIVQSSFVAMLAIVNGYMGWAAWDDKNKDKAAVAKSAVENPDTTTSVKVEQ